MFKKNYEKHVYKKFQGKMQIINNKTIKFDNNYVINNSFNPNYYLPIFENGLFYPQLLDCTELKLSGLEEVSFLSDNPKVKRFKFWMWYNDFANPQVYFIELTNSSATSEMGFKEFCKKAKLTFVKKGWFII